MGDASWPLQKAVFTALEADAGVKALVGDPARIYDHVPAKTTYPYIHIGDGDGVDWSSKTFTGQDHTIELHIWSRYRGSKEIKNILSAIHDVLHEAALTVTGHNLIILRFDFRTSFMDSDGLTRHGIIRFGALTHE